MINLKYKIFKKAKRFNKYNKRVLKLKRPSYKYALMPLRGRYKFKKKKLISEIKYQKNFESEKHKNKSGKKKRFQKYFKVKRTSHLIQHSFKKSFRIIDSFPISVRCNALRNHPKDRWRKSAKTRNKLELIYRTTFGKKLKRNFLSSRYLLRWNLLQKKYFSSYYSISAILPKLNFFKTFSEIKHKLLFNRKKKIFLNSDQNIKYNRAENLKIGDLIEVKGSLKTGYDVIPNQPQKFKYIKFGNKNKLTNNKKKYIQTEEIKELKEVNKGINKERKNFSSKDIELLERLINKEKIGIYTKAIKQNFISRSSAFSFVEYDNYAEQFIICKDLKNVSRSDAIFMNPSSKKLVSVNFLKK